MAQLAKVSVIASEGTIKALNEFLGLFSSYYLQFCVDRGIIVGRTKELETLSSDFSKRALELKRVISLDQFALMKASIEAGFKLAPTIAPALFSVREELGVPLDQERYQAQAGELMERLRNSVASSMERIDQIINENESSK